MCSTSTIWTEKVVVAKKWLLFINGGWYFKIAINTGKLAIMLVVIGRWLLFKVLFTQV
jgi:hypothetical protein